MEQEKKIKKSTVARNALNYGVILGVAMIIISLLLYILNLNDQSFSPYINIVLLIAGIIIGTLNYKKNNDGFISYGQSVGIGVLIGLFASIIVSIYSFIFLKFIDHGMIDVILRKAEERILEKNPTMSDDQIEKAMSYTRIFITPLWISIISIFQLTFMSFIASLIISIFTKKVDDSFESNFK
jgi:hypothetical protein